MATERKSYLNRFKPAGGGGFLNNVDGVILPGRWTDVFPGQDESKNQLFYILTTQLDGGDEPVTQALFAGAAENYVISEDGRSLTPTPDAGDLGGWTAFGLFYNSIEQAIAAGGDEVELRIPDDDNTDLNFDFLTGLRVRFVQVRDDYRMEQNAKAFKTNAKVGKKKAKDIFNAEGQRKGKDGKFYDERNTQVSTVYGYVEVDEAPAPKSAKTATATKTAAKSTTKATAAKPGKTVAKSSAPEVDIADVAAQAIAAILAEKGEILKSKLNLPVTKFFMAPANKELADAREDVRKFLQDDESLDSLVDAGVISYDKATQTISAAE